MNNKELEEKILKKIGAKLFSIRGTLSQIKAAKESGVSQNMVHRYEKGKTKPSTDYLKWASKKGNVTIESILSEIKTARQTPAYYGKPLNEDEGELLDMYRQVRPEYKKGAKAVLKAGMNAT